MLISPKAAAWPLVESGADDQRVKSSTPLQRKVVCNYSVIEGPVVSFKMFQVNSYRHKGLILKVQKYIVRPAKLPFLVVPTLLIRAFYDRNLTCFKNTIKNLFYHKTRQLIVLDSFGLFQSGKWRRTLPTATKSICSNKTKKLDPSRNFFFFSSPSFLFCWVVGIIKCLILEIVSNERYGLVSALWCCCKEKMSADIKAGVGWYWTFLSSLLLNSMINWSWIWL